MNLLGGGFDSKHLVSTEQNEIQYKSFVRSPAILNVITRKERLSKDVSHQHRRYCLLTNSSLPPP